MAGGLVFLYGMLSYAVALATILWGIAFEEGLLGSHSLDAVASVPFARAFTTDMLTFALFAVQHSGMARRRFKRAWTRVIPPAVERSTYVLASSLALSLVFALWQPLGGMLWNVHSNTLRLLLWAVSGLGWGIVLLSTFLIDHMELFGLRQVYDHMRGRASAPSGFRTPGLYRATRHPLYLGFLIAFWAAPTMSWAHLLFVLACTAYILVGIRLEERDLLAHFGDVYRNYQRRVPMLVPLLRGLREGKEEL